MGGRGLDAACSVGSVLRVDRWVVGCSRWVGPTGDLAGRALIWCRCRVGAEAAAVAVEAAAAWSNGWEVEAASPGLEAADEAVGAAAVWVNGWVVETAAAAAATAATAAAE